MIIIYKTFLNYHNMLGKNFQRTKRGNQIHQGAANHSMAAPHTSSGAVLPKCFAKGSFRALKPAPRCSAQPK